MLGVRTLLFLLVSFVLSQSIASANFASEDFSLETWIANERGPAVQGLLNNISPPGTLLGTVIASPSRANPDYYYHWVRDAALTMSAIFDMMVTTSNQQLRKTLGDALLQYMSAEIHHQNVQSITGIGEPKFEVTGESYTLPWGRPQNDSPALRAVTVMRVAQYLIKNNQTQFVLDHLYNPNTQTGLIKKDLMYVARNWANPSFDLWEEVQGQHFYTMMAIRRALVDGSQFAFLMGDQGMGQYLAGEAGKVQNQMSANLDANRGIIQQTVSRLQGIPKPSGLDSATVLAVLHSSRGDEFFTPENGWVLNTLLHLELAFQQLYPINSSTKLGVATGRYPEDVYSGSQQFSGGNPWFLTTFAFAEHHYRLASQLLRVGSINFDGLNTNFYRSLLPPSLREKVAPKSRVGLRDPLFNQILTGLISNGDGYFKRAAYHSGNDGALSEQFSRVNGFMTSANNLTWSYASFITAALARDQLKVGLSRVRLSR